MRYVSAGAFRTALEARLRMEQTDGVGVSRLRKRVVVERLLARLQEVAPGRWYLKGGFALELRLWQSSNISPRSSTPTVACTAAASQVLA
jgi:hypothetical protein